MTKEVLARQRLKICAKCYKAILFNGVFSVFKIQKIYRKGSGIDRLDFDAQSEMDKTAENSV